MKTIASICGMALASQMSAQSFILNPENGHYYAAVFSRGITWENARSQAESVSFSGSTGYLVTITSDSENNFVTQSFAAQFLASSGPVESTRGEAWAGGYQSPINNPVASSGWTWLNGEGSFPGVNGAVSGFDNLYSKWATAQDLPNSVNYAGEPNDAGGPGNEQFLALFRFQDVPHVWNDESNIWQLPGGGVSSQHIEGYIIEVTPVPEPTTYAMFSGLGLIAFSAYRRNRQ